jgi:riboflavin transporter FmnP
MRNSSKVSLIALLTALAVVLNLTIRIPAFYDVYLIYEVWEVPIVLALLLIGVWGAVTVAALNTVYLFTNPGPVLLGPVYNFIAVISMILGLLTAQKLMGSRRGGTVALVGLATAFGAVSRAGVMTLVNAAVVTQPPPIGYAIPGSLLAETLLFTGIFNLTVTLYTIPLAYSVRGALLSRYRVAIPGSQEQISGKAAKQHKP